MNRWRVGREFRVLDWDSECRPLSYMGPDYTSGELTAIAACWIGERKPVVWVLGECLAEEMLSGFMALYQEADVVTGHNIRRHDLPILSGALLEHGLGKLPGKLTQDTLLDLVKHRYLPASQEALAAMYDLPQPKKHMTQTGWRQANRLRRDGLALTRERVVSDVKQHMALRERLIADGALRPPRWWSA